ncbi:MAG: hypothetical protein HZC05_00245 [Candidatus Magasanikbacteria bacterium]|nr:hypothetical protein [Candidatus Magasanikbacteria bacterium]
MEFDLEQVRKKLDLAINQDTQTVDLPDFDIEEVAVKNWSELFAKNNLGRTVYLLIERSQRMQSKFLYFNLQQKEREEKSPVGQYKYFEICLAYLFFNALPFLEKEDLAGFLQQHALALLKIDDNPAKSIIDEYLFLEPEELTELSKKCLGALRASKEKVINAGQGKLIIGGVIAAYLASVHHLERASIDEISFLNSSNELKGISQAEKNNVLSVLKFYDHLEFPLLNLETPPLKPIFSAPVSPAKFVVAPKQMQSIQSKPSLPSVQVPIKPVPPPPSQAPVVPPKPSSPVFAQKKDSSIVLLPQNDRETAHIIEHHDIVAEKLIKESSLNVPLELQQRFIRIAVSRLKEVRGWVETRQKLMSPIAQGGMGFAYDDAERFLKLVESRKGEIASALPAGRQVAPRNDTKTVVAPVVSVVAKDSSTPFVAVAPLSARNDNKKDSSLRKLAETRNDKSEIVSSRSVGARNDAKTVPSHNDQKTSSDIIKAPPQPLKIVSDASKRSLAVLGMAKEQIPPQPPKPAPKIAIPQTPSGRSKMEDVTYRPRLVGPVEELREMSLVDFRRLSPQAKVTADKIYAKIELLAEESYEKKILGVKAWQESEVNKIYLGLLNESVDAAKPVQKMIEERQVSGQPTITYEEFKVVMELNRRLRT